MAPNSTTMDLKIHRLFGIEFEFFLLDNEGRLANRADLIINKLKRKLINSDIKQECANSMLELTSFPHMTSSHVFTKFFKDFETLLFEVDREEMNTYCYGTYPGKNNPSMRTDQRYKAKEVILGKEMWNIAGKCIGFHYHYSLPRNAFNPNVNFFYLDIKPRISQKVLNAYNLFIALDPAITAFMQSSPYYDGKFYGKDSRLMKYRGDPVFEEEDSLYHLQPEFGELNDYASDFRELTATIRSQYNKWNRLLKENDFSFNSFIKKESSMLDSSWKPVKISPHGTIESRGADMNSPSKVVALSKILRSLTRYTNAHHVEITPGSIGNNEPFKLEDEKLYVPESDILRKSLQKKSAFSGLDDKDIHKYCKALIKLVREIRPSDEKQSLRAFTDALDSRETTSDRIIKYVKKKQGYTNYRNLSDETAMELALDSSNLLFKDLLMTKKICDRSFW
ncbi:MAG: hypothetical protein KKF44_11360 [Nanoarchaeota archaeon]|nr:hypothetical protein [Nanoarchaeota archaeon]